MLEETKYINDFNKNTNIKDSNIEKNKDSMEIEESPDLNKNNLSKTYNFTEVPMKDFIPDIRKVSSQLRKKSSQL